MKKYLFLIQLRRSPIHEGRQYGTFEPNLFEPQSLLPGNGIFGAESKRSKRLRKGQGHRGRDNDRLNNPANSGLVVENREISVGTRVRGGGRSQGRTCLSNKFPGNREINREFRQIQPFAAI
jgi:hypothetical protein